MKLITPPGLLLTTALLAIFSIFAAQIALIERSFVLGAGATLAAVACAGTAYMRQWSQYLVYLMTTGFIVKWCWSVVDGWRVGYFSLMYDDPWLSVRSLIPGLALIVLSCLCSSLVYSHFRWGRQSASAPD